MRERKRLNKMGQPALRTEKGCHRLRGIIASTVMSIAIVTGSAGLIGSETSKKFHAENFDVVGIDNDMRARFFGADASTSGTRALLQASLENYQHEDLDIRDTGRVGALFARLGTAVK